MSIDHVHVTVRDLDASLRFYHDLLGLAVAWDSRDEAPSSELSALLDSLFARPVAVAIAQLTTREGTMLELIEFAEPAGRDLAPEVGDAGYGHIAFRVDDLAALHARLKASGASCRTDAPLPITLGPLAGGLVALVSDPDGVPIELLQRPA